MRLPDIDGMGPRLAQVVDAAQPRRRTMDRTILDSLLHKARTLADYAFNRGELPEDSRIYEEIDSTTKARDSGADPAIAPLMAEMQKVCKKANVTVDQVMHRETPLGRLNRWAVLATPYLIGFMTLLLTLYLAFQSSELHKADLALREYQDLESEHLQEKIYQAWKMYRYERVFNVKPPGLAQLDGYQQLVSDSKRLYEKRDAVQGLLLDASVIRYFPAAFVYHRANQRVADAVVAATSDPKPPVAAASGTTVQLGATEQIAGFTLDCSKEPETIAPSATDQSVLFGSMVELENYNRSIACFVQSSQIGSYYDYPMVTMIYAARNKVNLLVSWMLPGLYGLLGACVFLMRDLLRVNALNKAYGDARIVDLLSLLLRVSLGGLAGIIVGWFWVPTSSSPSSSTFSLSSISFGVAFLAGFSVDSLFALLDRLIKNFGQPGEEKTVKAAKKPDGGT
jgi:hypothetical protein